MKTGLMLLEKVKRTYSDELLCKILELKTKLKKFCHIKKNPNLNQIEELQPNSVMLINFSISTKFHNFEEKNTPF